MLRNNNRHAEYWRLVAVLPVIIIGNISTIGTGGNGDGDGDSNTRFSKQESFSFEVVAGNHDQFNLRGVNGEITISGDSGADSVLVSGIKRVQSSIGDQDATAHLSQLEVDWESVANAVNVETIQPQDSPERNYVVNYVISLPTYFKVQINSINAVVTVDSIENDVTVNIANGEVILTNIHGSALAHLVNGTIDSEVVLPLQGTIDLKVVTGGKIHLAIPANTSAEFSAKTLFGSINVTKLVFQSEVITSTSHSGILGSGQGMITLNTMGNINVSGF